jgi:hypothetical protein
VLQRSQYLGPGDNAHEQAILNDRVDLRLVGDHSCRKVDHAVTRGYAQHIRLHNLGDLDHLIPVVRRFQNLLDAVLFGEKAHHFLAIVDNR